MATFTILVAFIVTAPIMAVIADYVVTPYMNGEK